MKRQTEIVILTGKIQSGKTSFLKDLYLQNPQNWDGFLTPDVDGKRKLVFLSNGDEIELESTDMEHDGISIGRFHFSKKSFASARYTIQTLINSSKQYVIIDEIGKLELDGQGLEPELSKYIEAFHKKALILNSQKPSQKLILVIRDSLLTRAIDHYQLHHAQILTIEQVKSATNTIWLQ